MPEFSYCWTFPITSSKIKPIDQHHVKRCLKHSSTGKASSGVEFRISQIPTIGCPFWVHALDLSLSFIAAHCIIIQISCLLALYAGVWHSGHYGHQTLRTPISNCGTIATKLGWTMVIGLRSLLLSQVEAKEVQTRKYSIAL